MESEDASSLLLSNRISSDDLSHPLCTTVSCRSTYDNPWSTWTGLPGLRVVWRFLMSTNYRNLPRDKAILDQTLPVHKPDWDNFLRSKLAVVWLGHASVLVNLNGFIVLTDPVFSATVAPWFLQFLGLGPRRFRPVPCSVDEFPPLDAVVISHNHYDHLDVSSVRQIHNRFGNGLHWYVPMGLSSWFRSTLAEDVNVQEMTWWQTATHKTGASVTCVPAQHWSTRSLFDRFRTLWSGWVISNGGRNFYFAGDTGYCPAFSEIGRYFGEIHVAAIPVGAYAPRFFMCAQHVDPQQAVQIHSDVRSSLSIGIHWGTYDMGSKEFYMEPKELALSEAKEQGAEHKFVLPDQGAVLVVEEKNKE